MAGLLALLRIGVVEIHRWGATRDDVEDPDLLVFDLDPGPGIVWEFVLDTALGLRDFLAGEGFAPSVKTSGERGCTFRPHVSQTIMRCS